MTTADVAAFLWLVYFAAIFVGVLMPFMALSVTLSLRGIHRELKRMNQPELTAEAKWTAVVPATPAPDSARSLGHQLLR